MSHEAAPVFVIGSGPAGLAAAMALCRSGVPVRLVERADLIGGKVNSHREGGYSLEHGVHGWWMNYLNFDRLLQWASINASEALQEATGSTLILPDGSRYALKPLPWNVPSPLCVALQFLRARYLSIGDSLAAMRFAVHALAFNQAYDYDRYDGFSFQSLMDFCGVSPKVQQLLLEPFILSFDFAAADRVSAACGLSGLQFYLLHDQNSVLCRWAKGLPAEVIYDPIANKLEQLGVTLSLSTTLSSLQIENGQVAGLRLLKAKPADLPSPQQVVIGQVDLTQIPQDSFKQIPLQSGSAWVGHFVDGFCALGARCTHEGCTIDWQADQNAFVCPCHGGRFDKQGNVLQGPPKDPLYKYTCQVEGQTLAISGDAPPNLEPCSDVILATDLESAKEIVAQTDGLITELRHNIGHLDTTPVIVVRLWFAAQINLKPDIESAITPGFKFIDNFFHLNSFDEEINSEGQVVEVQAYRAGNLIDANDELILSTALEDLALIDPAYTRPNVTHYTINRHRALFTLYAPGKNDFRPSEASGTEGLHLAGDWTQAPWSVWMQERAIVSGLRAANAVLQRRGLPEVEILQLPREGILLRLSRFICLVLRVGIFRGLPMTSAPTPEELSAHLVRDHIINGWVAMLVAVCTLLPQFSPEFAGLLKVWPFPFIAISLYFFFHTEPDVQFQYGSWLRAWSDTPTLQHRIMTVGGVAGGLAELALVYWHPDSWILRALFPAGLVGAGIIFFGHHHSDKAVVMRQHYIMATLFVVIGLTFLGARFVPMFAPLAYTWPILFGIEAFLFITYTEDGAQAPGAGPDASHSDDGHSHTDDPSGSGHDHTQGAAAGP